MTRYKFNVFLVVVLASLRLFYLFYQQPIFGYDVHDTYLYINRAYNYIIDGSFGVYNSQTLLKNPDFSVFLAFLSKISMPYQYYKILAYLILSYITVAICKIYGISGPKLILVIFVSIFNPVLLTQIYNQPLRELTQLLFFVIAVSLFVAYSRTGKLIWIIIFSFVYTILIGLREENIILIIPFFIYSIFQILRSKSNVKTRTNFMVILTVSFIGLFVNNWMAVNFINKNYGINLKNDFSGGNFPVFIEAIREIKSEKSDYVSIPKSVMVKLSETIPGFDRIYSNWPDPVIHNADYIEIVAGKKEWRDSHNYIWIKDAFYVTYYGQSAQEIQDKYLKYAELIKSHCGHSYDCEGYLNIGLVSFRSIPSFKVIYEQFLHVILSLISPNVDFYVNSNKYLPFNNGLSLEKTDFTNKKYSVVLNSTLPVEYYSFDGRLNNFVLKSETNRASFYNLYYLFSNPDVLYNCYLNLDESRRERQLSNGSSVVHYFKMGDFGAFKNGYSEVVDDLLVHFESCIEGRDCTKHYKYANEECGRNHYSKYGIHEGRYYPNFFDPSPQMTPIIHRLTKIYVGLYRYILSPATVCSPVEQSTTIFVKVSLAMFSFY